MAIKAKYDAKRKKIIVEIDYDPSKNYEDNRPDGKSKVLDTNTDRKIEGAPDNVWYTVGLYEKKKAPKGKAMVESAIKTAAKSKKASKEA